MIERLIIADPGMASLFGHHYEVSVAYAEAGERLGLAPVILSHVAFAGTPTPGIRVQPTFRYNPYDPPRWLRPQVKRPDVGPDLSILAKDLFNVAPAIGADESACVYLHSCSLSMVNDLIEFFLLQEFSKCPVFFLRFIYEGDPSGVKYPSWYLAQLRKKLRASGLVGRKVFFFAETQALADQLSALLRLPVARIHHVSASATSVQSSVRTGLTDPRRVTLAYLGEARREKGFNLLPEVVKAIGQDQRLASRCELVIQAASTGIDRSEAQSINRTMQEIARYRGGLNVTYVRQRLSKERYSALIREVDIPLLLHDPTAYRTRGSAIFYDVMLAAKPFLVREGSSMADEPGVGGMRVWPNDEPVTNTLEAMFDEYAALVAEAQKTASVARPLCDPEHILQQLLLIGQRRDQSAPPSVVFHVVPNWFGQGSSHTFQAHTEYLARKSVRVVDVVVWTSDDWPLPEPDFYERLFEGTLDSETFYTFHLQRGPSALEFEEISLTRAIYRRLSYAQERQWLFDSSVPAGLVHLLSHETPAFAWINYSHYMPARQLLGNPKVLLETHDIRAGQYALEAGNPALEAADAPIELAWMDRADAVIFVSEQERLRFIGERTETVPSTCALGVLRRHVERKRTEQPFHGREMLENFHVATAAQRRVLDDLMLAGRAGKCAFFVGSAHTANLLSLDWLLREVHFPRLMPAGVELCVLGSIGDQYTGGVPGVKFLGRIKHLEPVLRGAGVILLPVMHGTGIPVKCIDALMADRPIVATPKAFEAVSYAGEAIDLHQDPDAFAADVLGILSDPAHRDRVIGQARQLAHRLLGEGLYERTIDDLLSRAGIDIENSPPRAADEDAYRELCLRRLFRKWDETRPMIAAAALEEGYLQLSFDVASRSSPLWLQIRSRSGAAIDLTIGFPGGGISVVRCGPEGGTVPILVDRSLSGIEFSVAGDIDPFPSALLEFEVLS